MVGASDSQKVLTDRVDPSRAAALMATLGMEGKEPLTGDPLPPFFHHIYFWDPAPADALGVDGHRASGGLVPVAQGAHRMWAGGRLTTHAPFCAGISARKITTMQEVARKAGRTGDLTFVTLRHQIMQRGKLTLAEEQVIVYREEIPPPATLSGTPRIAEARIPIRFPAATLFRYSALTFNAHRIHYDPSWCRDVLNFPDLVVHGPLMAQYLALLAADRLGALASFTYRAHAPFFAGETGVLCATGQDVWLEGADGRLCMTAAGVAR